MRFGRLFLALSACAAALMMLAGAGTAASGPDVSAPASSDLSSVASIQHYLRSIGVNPRQVVIQRGLRNYAGPKCPGRAWTCTKARRVFQSGDENKFECTPSLSTTPPVNSGGTQTCVIEQMGASNSARCKERTRATTAVQECTIMQTGAQNSADVDQFVDSNDGPTQDASQKATVTQTGSTGKNDLQLTQQVKQDVHGDASQKQDAHQRADVIQTATTGSNSAQVKQDQDQKAHGALSQSQNTLSGSLGPCALLSQPNACANIMQTTAMGNSDNRLRQTINEDAHSEGIADQRQGSFTGGIDGRVHQDSGIGTSTNNADQKKHQEVHAKKGSSQSQIDPLSCCGAGSSLGNTNSSEKIDQDATQNASEGSNAFQDISLLGMSRATGQCTISHHAKTDSDSVNNSLSSSPTCPQGITLVTTCASAGDQPVGNNGTCTSFTPPTCIDCSIGFAKLSLTGVYGRRH